MSNNRPKRVCTILIQPYKNGETIKGATTITIWDHQEQSNLTVEQIKAKIIKALGLE